MTKSGTGYLYFLIYLSFKILSEERSAKKYLLLILLPILFFLLLPFLSSIDLYQYGRGIDVIFKLGTPEVFFEDNSVFTRLVSLSLGFFSILLYPFGAGNGSAINIAQKIVTDNQFLYSFYQGRGVGFNSSFSYLMVSNGLIFLIFFILGYFYFSKTKFVNKIFSAIFFIISYSAAFPAIWILLCL
jgi:hypothetical protein